MSLLWRDAVVLGSAVAISIYIYTHKYVYTVVLDGDVELTDDDGIMIDGIVVAGVVIDVVVGSFFLSYVTNLTGWLVVGVADVAVATITVTAVVAPALDCSDLLL